MNAQQVLDLFVEQRLLQPSQADDVLQEAQLNGKNIEQALIDGGFVDEHGFYQVVADALGTDFVDLSENEIAAGNSPIDSRRSRAAPSRAPDHRER